MTERLPGAREGLGRHLGGVFQTVPQRPRADLRGLLAAEQGGPHRPQLSPNSSSVGGFWASHVWTKDPAAAALLKLERLMWSHTLSFQMQARTDAGNLPESHTVGSRWDRRRRDNKNEPHGRGLTGEDSTFVLTACEPKGSLHLPPRFNSETHSVLPGTETWSRRCNTHVITYVITHT